MHIPFARPSRKENCFNQNDTPELGPNYGESFHWGQGLNNKQCRSSGRGLCREIFQAGSGWSKALATRVGAEPGAPSCSGSKTKNVLQKK